MASAGWATAAAGAALSLVSAAYTARTCRPGVARRGSGMTRRVVLASGVKGGVGMLVSVKERIDAYVWERDVCV